ncbi:ImmA/IrrE family metallo-endopeptidase [Glutamicibacter halophytocola]|uniref:ImmA/IrrE family metallo-endopeptidase n=1 Tax=Glutamicibacter halophytocola TaxID=1933880 RepID=A0AA95BR94_9MICC|nr:ImmA/IrrE family metallo-endopeptidase [Glutamicibacter halophytocola]UUX60131.1 ImmA/IrrE family metallo-endopeptidase [Glutamicibacter halophytocola]
MQNIFNLLRTISHVAVIWNRPYPDIVAATNGRSIWIDPALTSVERVCYLTHEAIHIKHGHTGCQGRAIERQVCLEVAQFLVPFESLQGVASWSRHPAEMADELGVTEEVLLDRLATLDGDQIQALWPPSEHIP